MALRWSDKASDAKQEVMVEGCSFPFSYHESMLVSFNRDRGRSLTLTTWLLLLPWQQRSPDLSEAVIFHWS